MEQLRPLLPFMRPYVRRLLIGITCAAFGATVSALGPYVLRLAIDALQTGQFTIDLLLTYGGLLLLIAVADGLFKFGQRMFIAVTAYRVEYDLRQALFTRLLALEQRFYGDMHTGDLMARVTNDLSSVRQLLGPGINGTATGLLTMLAAVALMSQVNLTLTCVVLAMVPLMATLFILVSGRMHKISSRVQDQFGALSTRVQENFSGIRTIKAYAQEAAEAGVFAQANDHYRTLNLRYVLYSGALWPSVSLIIGLAATMVLLIGGQLVAAGQLTIGELVQFNAYIGLLVFPAIMMGWIVSLYQQAVAAMERINVVLNRRPLIATAPTAQPLPTIHGALAFRNVGIRFDHTQYKQAGQVSEEPPPAGWLLRSISFTVPTGSSLAIVGATGVGKTTLINLLGRVRDPDEGAVLLDGHDVRTLPLEQLRSVIAYVPQETFLFSVPLRENITFGLGAAATLDTPATRARIDHAVEVSRFSNDLVQFPAGLDTLVGERGVTLSGGQKQRVALARAVLRDPVVLILDDAMSSVDTHTAAQILAGLRTVMRGRTSVIIAQRIATVKDADQIIVLHEGAIVERGTHMDLVRAGGRYAAMYRRELLRAEFGEEVEDVEPK